MDVLKALANKTNQGLLSLLRAEPTYARKAASLLELSETEATRRLRQLEKMGLVTSAWSHIGKNVKLYTLAAASVRIGIGAEGLEVHLDGPTARRTVIGSATMRIPDPGSVVGRDEVLAQLDAPVVVLRGLPGIGKTSIAAAHARNQSRPVFWYAFRGVESLDWLANRLGLFLARQGDSALLEAVQADMEPAEKRERMLLGIDGPSMLVLDDVHKIEDPHVRMWLRDAMERTQEGRLIVLGRDPLPQGRDIHVQGLTDDAVAVLVDAAGHVVTPRLLGALRRRCGGHPLAIHLLLEAAARGGGLEAILKGVPAEGLDAYLLAEIDARLTESERRLLAAASTFRTDFALADVRALARVHRKDLLALGRHGLVLDRGGRHALHEVVRTYFYARLATKKEYHEKAAALHLGHGTIEGRLEAMHHFLASGNQDRVLDLLEKNLDLREFDFVDAGYTRLYLEMLGLLDDVDVGLRHRALIEDEKGDIHLHRGGPEAALVHYDAARALFEDQGDSGRVSDVDWKRALAHQRIGDVDSARRICLGALPAARDASRRRLEELVAGLPA